MTAQDSAVTEAGATIERLKKLEDSEKKDKEKSEEKEKADHKKDKKKDSKKEDDKKEVKPLVFDLENSRDRVIRLTVNSSRLGDAVLTPKGQTILSSSLRKRI